MTTAYQSSPPKVISTKWNTPSRQPPLSLALQAKQSVALTWLQLLHSSSPKKVHGRLMDPSSITHVLSIFQTRCISHMLAKRIADIVQIYTQSASMQLLVFKVDCVGHYLPFCAVVSRGKEQKVVNFLEKK
eukprot:2112777-Ditylum_brightwellii.AAC.1